LIQARRAATRVFPDVWPGFILLREREPAA